MIHHRLLIMGLPLASVLCAQRGYAQNEMLLRDKGVQPYSIELKPLPTAISAIPHAGALGSFGVGTEMFLTANISWLANATYVDLRLSNDALDKSSDANKSQAVISTQRGYQFASGFRWYSSAFKDSWYGEGNIGYTSLSGDFRYEDISVASREISVTPTVIGGYRWLFDNDVLIRLGIGGSVNSVQSRSATASNPNSLYAEEAEYKVRNIQRTPLIAQVDLGVGYAF